MGGEGAGIVISLNRATSESICFCFLVFFFFFLFCLFFIIHLEPNSINILSRGGDYYGCVFADFV